jgi:anaerobic selenocysteine-containing dehydrogenase
VSPLYRRPQSSRPLRVEGYVATRVGSEERGPEVRMRSEHARERMMVDGELVIVEGPRRQQLAQLRIDDTVPRGGVVIRDIAGVAPSEVVHVMKPDLDDPTPGRGTLA